MTRSTAPPRILWLDNATPGQLLVEVRAMDRIGLLALLTRALERAGADIVWAKVNTFGSTAADVFCVRCRPEESEQAREPQWRKPTGRAGRARGRAARRARRRLDAYPAAHACSELNCRTASMRALS